MRKFPFFISLFIFAFLFFLFIITLLPTVYAQSACGTGAARATGLVSTPIFTSGSVFTTTGACIINSKTAFTPFKIPTYDELKSIYFDQARDNTTLLVNKNPAVTGSATQANIPIGTTENQLYYVNGDLTLSSAPTGDRTGVIFVEGNLTVTDNIIYTPSQGGLMFVVKGNVNVSYTPTPVTQVDAVIISEGTICTAFNGTSCPATNVTTSQLIINGSLISLKETTPIKFRRTLSDNTQPAEKINHQVKYLVLLKDLYSDTLQRWQEVDALAIIPPIPPPPPPAPPPPPPSPPPPAPGFKFSLAGSCSQTDTNCSLGNINVTTGESGSNTIIITQTSGTTSIPVSLSVSTGAPASFNPISCSPNCTSTFTVTANADAGTYPITVTGTTPGGQTQTTTFNLIITCKNGYKDFDKDEYGTGAFGCYNYNVSYNIVSNNTDCSDSNKDVYPGQTLYFATHRGDNSFDYDCNGQEDTEYPLYANLTTLPDCKLEFQDIEVVGNTCGTSAGYICTVTETRSYNSDRSVCSTIEGTIECSFVCDRSTDYTACTTSTPTTPPILCR